MRHRLVRMLPLLVPLTVVVGTSGGDLAGASSRAHAATPFARVLAAVVDVNTRLGYQHAAAAGTGIVLSANGFVLTNNHVIRGATTIRVRDVGNGHSYRASVVGYDVAADVAVLRLAGATRLTTAPIAHPPTAPVGTPVTAIGNAAGVGGAPNQAAGVVTALGAKILASDVFTGASERLTHLLESNAALQPGDSGGPLVNASGAVVGMDTAASSGGQPQSTSLRAFAIPIKSALAIAGKIRKGRFSGRIHPGATAFLGVEVPPANGASSGQPIGAPVVAGVLPGSPAQSAGLGAGSVITTLNGAAVPSPNVLTADLLALAPGTTVQLGWTDQSGVAHVASVVLASGPPQ